VQVSGTKIGATVILLGSDWQLPAFRGTAVEVILFVRDLMTVGNKTP
jgi:hypothetical protein